MRPSARNSPGALPITPSPGLFAGLFAGLTFGLSLCPPLLPFSPFGSALAQERMARPRWALVLSGGAARGLAHVGVVRALEKEGLRPDVVYGTSMGAVVGGLYASGLSSAEIEEQLARIDWFSLFSATAAAYEWRSITLAQPWVTLEGAQGAIRLPGGFVEDERLEYELVRAFLLADAYAQGDFDRMPIPFRAVASDANTLAGVTLRSGSVAQAVRASLAIPVVFPPVWLEDRLLVDGGLAANLPLAPAREEGFDAILAVDVALPPPGLTENSSALEIGLALLDRLDKRGQPDSLLAGEQLIWLKLEGFSAADFMAMKEMIQTAHADAAPQVRAFAQMLGHAGSDSARADSSLRLPPVRPPLEWQDREGRTARRADTVRGLFGEPPADSFAAEALVPGIERVYRSGLLRSAWPAFEVRDDSTDLSFVVRERAAFELDFAAGWDLDRKIRGQARASLRPRVGSLPPQVVLGGTARTLGWNAFVSIDPHALDRGSSGSFVRGDIRKTKNRIFSAEDEWEIVETQRIEGFIGRQFALPTGDILQAGGGYGSSEEPESSREGPLLALRAHSDGRIERHMEISAQLGADSYQAGDLAAGVAFLVRPFTIRPSLALGFASEDAPLDDWPGLGGPTSLGGLRDREWLGRRSFSGALTLIHRTGRVFDISAALQAGRVDDAVGRPDLSGRIRFAGDFGVQVDIPLGPLRIDWGITEGGQNRVDIAFGQIF